MKRILIILHNLVVLSCLVPYTLAVINVTITGTTTRHVCKGEDIDFKWTYDDTDPDKDFIKTIQWSKDPSSYLIMQYESDTNDLTITSNPNDYTARVERTTEAGSNDIGMRLIKAGSTSVDDEGKYYVSLIVDKPGGDANDYFVPYRDPQGVTVYVCVGVDDTYPLPSLSLTYDETTHNITCSGPSSLGNTTFAIFDPSMDSLVDSTTDTTISKIITADPPGGTYRCKTYCTEQGHEDTPQGKCLPSDATLVIPSWSIWGAWDSNCDVPGSSRTHTRTCTNPAPVNPPDNGPQSCQGVDTETEICPTPPPTPSPGPCLSSPCANGGACVDMGNSFNCSCAGMWKGTTCTEHCNCNDGSRAKRSTNDEIQCQCSVKTFTPCTSEYSGIPNGSFVCNSSVQARGPNDSRRRRSAEDKASSPGFSFNIIDENNFDMVYFRTNDQYCFEVGSFVNRTFEKLDMDNDCGSYRITTDWFDVELHVSDTVVLLKLDNGKIEKSLVTKHPFKPSLGFVQGPPYTDECSYDCRFGFANISVYQVSEPETGKVVEMDGFCSSPIRGGCLALIIVLVILYLINIYVLILICHTFIKRVDNLMPIWAKIILIIAVIIVPLVGAVIAAVYVYNRHRGKNKQDHSGKYFLFRCPCKYQYSSFDGDVKNVTNGRGSQQNNRITPEPDKETNTQTPAHHFEYDISKKSNNRILPPLKKPAAYDLDDVNSSQQTKQTIENEDVDTNKEKEEKEAQEEQGRRQGREGGEGRRHIIEVKENTSENSATRNSYESLTTTPHSYEYLKDKSDTYKDTEAFDNKNKFDIAKTNEAEGDKDKTNSEPNSAAVHDKGKSESNKMV